MRERQIEREREMGCLALATISIFVTVEKHFLFQKKENRKEMVLISFDSRRLENSFPERKI